MADQDLTEEQRASLERICRSNRHLEQSGAAADAVVHVRFSDASRFCPVVVPNENQARTTNGESLKRVVEYNTGQPYSFTRDQLVRMLETLVSDSRTPLKK